MTALRQVAQTIGNQLIVAANDNNPVEAPRKYTPPTRGYIRVPTPANDNRYVGYNRVGRGLIVGALKRNIAFEGGMSLYMITRTIDRAYDKGPTIYGPGKPFIMCGGGANTIYAPNVNWGCGELAVLNPGSSSWGYKGGRSGSMYNWHSSAIGVNERYQFAGGFLLPTDWPAGKYPLKQTGRDMIAQQNPSKNYGHHTGLDLLTHPKTFRGPARPVPWRALRYRNPAHPSNPYLGLPSMSSTREAQAPSRRDLTASRLVVGVVGSNRPVTRPGKVTNPSTPTRPPRGTKERKARFRNGALAVLGRGVVDTVTETLDVFEAFWNAIPAWRRGQFVGNFKARNGKLPTVTDRAIFVYRNVQHLDVGQLMKNLLVNQIEDAIIGRLIGGANRSPFVQWTRDMGLSSPFGGPTL